jgi:hypothetical protein
MLSTDIIFIAKALARKPEQEPFFQVLDQFSEIVRAIPTQLSKSNGREELLARVKSVVNGVGVFKLHAAAKSYQAGVDQVVHFKATDLFSLYSVRSRIDVFLDMYEAFVPAQREEKALALIIEGDSLGTQLRTLSGAYENLEAVLRWDVGPQTGGVIDLVLDGEFDFDDVSFAIDALRRSYWLICEFIGVSPEQEPLALVKIESGSLRILARGSAVAITALKTFVTALARYAFISKRVSDTQVSAEGLKTLIEIRSSMKDAGLKTSHMDGGIEETAGLLTSQLCKLVSQSNSIGIDGTFVSLAKDVAQIGRDPRRLEHLPPEK